MFSPESITVAKGCEFDDYSKLEPHALPVDQVSLSQSTLYYLEGV